MSMRPLQIAMLSIHSCPVGELGTKDTGGMNVYVKELASELGTRGHRVDLYTRLHDPNDSRIIELSENVRLVHVEAGNNGVVPKLEIYPHLGEFCRALEHFRIERGVRYDLIHSHYWLSGEVGSWLQDRWGVPHVLTFHTFGAAKNGTDAGQTEPRLRLDSERRLVNTCHRIIATTQKEKADLIRHYGAHAGNVGVVPCGVNLRLFQPVDKVAARQELGLEGDANIALYVGRFAPIKGINRLLEAMSHLVRDRGKKTRLVIVGGDGDDTPEFRKLKKRLRELGIRDVVRFEGRMEQDRLPAYYSAADVLVVPSYYESFGLVALEALACGTPVVGTKVGAVEEIVREGSTGWVASAGDPRSIAEGMRKCFSAQNAKATSAGSIRSSIRRFSWSNVADAMIDEYASVLTPERVEAVQPPSAESPCETGSFH